MDFQINLSLEEFGELLLDDVFRLTGAKGERNLFLFENGLLIVKRRDDGAFLYKNYIAVSGAHTACAAAIWSLSSAAD